MIFNGILNILYYFITGVIGVIPSGSIPDELSTAITDIGTYIAYIKMWFPIDTLFTVIGIILAIEGILLIYYFVMWVIHRIPTQ